MSSTEQPLKGADELRSNKGESNGSDRLTHPTTQQEPLQRKAQNASGDARQVEDEVGDARGSNPCASSSVPHLAKDSLPIRPNDLADCLLVVAVIKHSLCYGREICLMHEAGNVMCLKSHPLAHLRI